MKNLSPYGKVIIVLVVSFFAIIAIFYDYAKADNALKLYVWDFGTRDGTKDKLTRNLTQEFEEALIQKKCCIVLERRKYDRLGSQKENEKAILAIEGISQESLDGLKLLHAEAVIFGEVYDDSDSDEIKVTATVQTFNGVIIDTKSVRFPRNKRGKAAIREENMLKLVEELCASLVPSSPQEASQVMIFVEDFIGPEQPHPEVTQALVNDLTAVAAPYSNVRVRKLGRSIPESKTITLNDPNYIGIAIGGRYKQPPQGGILDSHIRTANLSVSIPKFIQDFWCSFQPYNPSEMSYFRDFVAGLSRLVVKDWEESEIQFSKSLEKLSNSTDQRIRFKLTEQSLENLRKEGIPDNILKSLKKLENQGFANETEFLIAVKKQIGEKTTATYKELILKYANQDIESIIYTLRGMAYIGQGKMNEGHTDFEQAKKINPRITVPVRSTGFRFRQRILGAISRFKQWILEVVSFIWWLLRVISIIAISIMIIAVVVIGLIKSTKDKPRVDINPKTKTLTSALGIETRGLRGWENIFSIILEKGSKIPQRHTEVFTTVRDYQTTAEIHVLQGLHPLAPYNRSVGKLLLESITPAPQGVPQISVTFDINSKGVLHVQAKDLGTKRTIKHKFKISSRL